MKKIFIAIVVMLLIYPPSIAENTLQTGIKKTTYTKTDETLTEFEDENVKITRDKKYFGTDAVKDTNTCGYIYKITNKSTAPIIIKEVASPDRINYATSTANVYYGTNAAFALTAVSGLLFVSSLNDVKTYLKPFPQSYTVNQKSTIQVLFLAKKYIDPRVKFEFEINGHLKTINSKSTYIVKDTKYYKDLIKSQHCLNGYFWLQYNITKREIPLIEAYLKSGTLKENESSKSLLLGAAVNNEVNQKSFCGTVDKKISPYVTDENIKIIELLLKSGVNPNAENVKSLMFQAMRTKDAKIISLLLAYGADPNRKYMGRYPAYQAIIYNQPEILELLLDAGANPNVSVKGKTLLQWSTRKKHPEMAKMLINKGANIE